MDREDNVDDTLLIQNETVSFGFIVFAKVHLHIIAMLRKCHFEPNVVCVSYLATGI